MPVFGFTIFLSAFLLFIVQPLLAKILLPSFGSSPSVWLCNVLFFQVVLLFGYLYAFLLTRMKVPLQILIHSVLIILSLFFLPLNPLEHSFAFSWPPFTIFTLLSCTFGLPGIIISATSPLFQHWFCLSTQTEFPAKYYALSNFGSLLGLLAFPFLIEPTFPLSQQLTIWAFLYGAYLVGTFGCLFILNKRNTHSVVTLSPTTKISPITVSIWLILTLLSSALLLSSTQIMMQNIANFPLLWVIPLALYLISYIVIFSEVSTSRFVWYILYFLMAVIALYYPSHHNLSLKIQILVYSTLLFSGCMICHGELFRLKPAKQSLTFYYLMIALGGVLGGLFINFVAPLLFNDYWDFYITLLGIFFYGIALSFFTLKLSTRWSYTLIFSWALGGFVLTQMLYDHEQKNNTDLIFKGRSFFGTFSVTERNRDILKLHYRTLNNGSILHGQQFIDPFRSTLATTYYSQLSGIGLAIYYQRLQHNDRWFKGLRIGAIGLGTGTLAALALKGDILRFYEIDPQIEILAKQYFSYLKESKALIDITIGDGRISLKRLFNQSGSENYDVIAIDAFNGDAIPIHLLTLEAFKVYLSQLAPKGILAFHITNRYLDLYPPLQAIASNLGLFSFIVHNASDSKNWISSSEWILITADPELGPFLYQKNALTFRPERTTFLWTDDLNYLLSAVKW